MSLLRRVVLIIGAALLPPLAMQAFNEMALHSARREEVRRDALREARAIGAELDAIVGGVRNALVATSAIPGIRAADVAACQDLLLSVFADLSFLREVMLVGDNDRVLCSTDPEIEGTLVGETPEISLARGRGGMALGDYTPGHGGEGPELPAAYAVRGLPGAGPVLVGEIDLNWLRARLTSGKLPEDAAVTLSDRNGVVLVATADAARVGRPAPPHALAPMRGHAGALAQEVGVDGVSRAVATVPLEGAAADMRLSVGLPTEPVFAAADAATRRGYALIGGGFVLALALAAWMARSIIGRPVSNILETTGRWQAGDTAARVADPGPRSEFGRIAAAVNALLDAVVAGQAGIAEQLAHLRAVYDGSPVGLGYIGRDFRYVSVNARLAEINDIPAEAHRGRTIRELLPTVAWRVEPLLARALHGEAIPPHEVQAATEAEPGTPRRLIVSYHPAVSAAGAVLGVVVAVQDVTALRRTEAALHTALERANAELERRVEERTRQLESEVRDREAAQAQLQQAQKMEVIGQLTGGVAHDFNNLLTAIIGNLELALARSQNRPDLVRLLSGAMRSADRGAALTQRMLAFGRRQFLRLQPVDIAALLEGMAELIARTIGPAVEVRIEAEPDLPAARADPNQIELVVLNLALNARDAMPRGGTILITAAADRVEPGPAPAPGLQPGTYVRLSVADDGEGMDAATLARAFEPFFTTKPVGRGSGLGLPMVQGVVAQSGGAVAIRSTVGSGTVVTVWLPRAEAPRLPASAAPPRAEPALPGGGHGVMLVDDDPEVAAFGVTCLEDAGYAVRQASSGAEALGLLRAEGPPHLLIIDLGMPGMNGLQLAAAARRLYPDLAILIATGYAAEDAESLGAVDLPVLNKPFKAADLLARVAELLRTTRPPPAAAPTPAARRFPAETG